MSDDDSKLLEIVTSALKRIDKEDAAIRFQSSGEHINENRIIGNLNGYQTLGLRIVEAALKCDGKQNGALNLQLSDILIVRTGSNEIDIGFDEFVLSEKCELSPDQWEKESRMPEWLRIVIGMLIVCIPAYVFYEGIVAIWHKLF